MKISRQGERSARFQTLFKSMPMWETWNAPRHKPECTWLLHVKSGETAPGQSFWGELNYTWCQEFCKINHQDFALIPRRVRRDMARQRAKREYRVDHGLSDPMTRFDSLPEGQMYVTPINVLDALEI